MTAPGLVVWLLAALAAYRLWRLLALDDLPGLADVRHTVMDRWPGRWTDAIVCPWCLGWWCCVAVYGALAAAGVAYDPAGWIVHVGAASTLVGLTGSRLDD